MEEMNRGTHAANAEAAVDTTSTNEGQPESRATGLDIPTDIASRKIVVSRGARKNDFNWARYPTTFGALVKMAAKFTRGDKDGPCITGGELNGATRNAVSVTANHLLMFDSDYGHTLDELEAAVRNTGYACWIYTTYSHLKSQSDIGEGAIAQVAKKAGMDYDPSMDSADLVPLVKEYYAQKPDKLHPRIVASVSRAERVNVEGEGVKIRFTHDPLPRARLVFILDEPFQFVLPNVMQKDRINEWKDRYKGFAKKFNLSTDGSCVDPSRLMYLPRISPSADETIHEQRWIDGSLVKFGDIPREADLKKEEQANPFAAAVASMGGVKPGTDSRGIVTFKTPGLAKFFKGKNAPAKYFEAATWLSSQAPEDVRNDDAAGKIEFKCPNDENHSNPGDPNDRAFFVVDASSSEHGFHMHCQHDTCRRMSEEATGRMDRAWFLDLACQKYNIKHADELLDDCIGWEGYDDEEDEEPSPEQVEAARDEVAELIGELSNTSDTAAINAVVARAAEATKDDPIGRAHFVSVIAEKTKMTKVDVKHAFKMSDKRRAREAEKASSDNTIDAPRHGPPEGDAAKTATTIFDHWSHNEQVRVTRAAFVGKNAKSPKLFERPEGGYVRVIENAGSDKIALVEDHVSAVWQHELARVLRFVKTLENGREKEVSPFSAVVADFVGASNIGLPTLQKVTNVPVFASDGTLITTHGYNGASETWLSRSAVFDPVPTTPTEEEVAKAFETLQEPFRDFPFSDDFGGNDMLPIRSEVLDAEGFPLPNWERGKASRLAAMAMTLQPFVRAVIGDGHCPMYHVGKSAPGTGAGRLVDVSQMILTGKTAEVSTMNHNPEEFRKEITAKLRQGAPTIFLDNINQKIDDEGLAAALTSHEWSARILGRSENVTLPNDATWIIAGNNVELSGELLKRACPIRLDASTPDPENDRPPAYYKHPDVVGWCKRHRKELVWSCHALVQNWLAKGRPIGTARLGRFDRWSAIMGGIFEAAGVTGFLTNVDSYLTANTTDEDGDVEEFVLHLFDKMKGCLFSAQEAYEHCLEDPLGYRTNSTTAEGNLLAAYNSTPGLADTVRMEFKFKGIPLSGRSELGKVKSLADFIKKHIEGKTFKLGTGEFVKFVKTPFKRKVLYQIIQIGK